MNSNNTKAIVIAAIVGALALGSVGIAGAAGVKALATSKSTTTSAEPTRDAKTKSRAQGTTSDMRDGKRAYHADGDRGVRGFGGQGDIAEALAKLSGLSEAEVRAKRNGGTSYADIAASKNVAAEALIAETVKIETAELDEAVKAGKLTAAQKAGVLKDIESRLAEEIKRTESPKDREGKRGDRDGDSRGSRGTASAPATTR